MSIVAASGQNDNVYLPTGTNYLNFNAGDGTDTIDAGSFYGIVDLGEKAFEINKELGKSAASSCDFAILVGEKQAEPIYAGLKEEKYPQEKVFSYK